MKRKRFTALKVTLTPSPEVTPELPLPTSTPKPTPVPKNGLLKEGKVYRYYVNNKPVRNKWKKINGKYYWFKSNGVAALMDITRLKEFFICLIRMHRE